MTRTERKKIFAEKLCEQMIKHKMSCVTVADACGVSRQAVDRYRKGYRLPSLWILPDLCGLFGVDMCYWFEE